MSQQNHPPFETGDFMKLKEQPWPDFNPENTSSPQHRKQKEIFYNKESSFNQAPNREYSPIKSSVGSYSNKQSWQFESPRRFNNSQQSSSPSSFGPNGVDNFPPSDSSFIISDGSFNSVDGRKQQNNSRSNCTKDGENLSAYLHSSFTEDPWEKLERCKDLTDF